MAGIPIAFFSGLGVALSVLDDQTSSLVGVAISASLLPPAGKCVFLSIMHRDMTYIFLVQSLSHMPFLLFSQLWHDANCSYRGWRQVESVQL